MSAPIDTNAGGHQNRSASNAGGHQKRSASLPMNVVMKLPTLRRAVSEGLYSEHDVRLDTQRFTPGESGVFGGIFNYTNVIVGSGLFGMPYALYICGLWMGAILLIVTTFYTAVASHWIVKIGLKRQRYNYEDLTRTALGPIAGHLHCYASFFFAFTSSISYAIIAGQSLRDVSQGLGATGVLADRRFYTLICGVLIMLPLALFRDMHCLRFTSTVSIVTEASVILLVAVYSRPYSQRDNDVVPFHEDKSERLGYFVGPSVLAGLSIFLFAFVGQQASFEVYRSLKHPSVSSWETVANVSIFMAWALAILVSIPAWLNLGDSIEANVMDTFGPTDVPTLVGKVFLAMAMCLTFPIDFFICRRNMNEIIFVDYFGMPDYMGPWRFYSLTLILWAMPIAIGIMFKDLSFVIGLGGAVGASFVGYITPSLMYIKIFRPEIVNVFETKSKWHWIRCVFLPITCFLFGILALVAGTVGTFMHFFDKN